MLLYFLSKLFPTELILCSASALVLCDRSNLESGIPFSELPRSKGLRSARGIQDLIDPVSRKRPYNSYGAFPRGMLIANQ